MRWAGTSDEVESDAAALGELLRRGPTLALAGAGISTDSVQHREFVRSADARKRYWARSMIGFARFAAALPNAGHSALATLEARGHVLGLITQNVDSLLFITHGPGTEHREVD